MPQTTLAERAVGKSSKGKHIGESKREGYISIQVGSSNGMFSENALHIVDELRKCGFIEVRRETARTGPVKVRNFVFKAKRSTSRAERLAASARPVETVGNDEIIDSCLSFLGGASRRIGS